MAESSEQGPERVAVVTGGARNVEQVRAYLPRDYSANEEVMERHAVTGPDGYRQSVRIVIRGHDFAGWTMEDYVVPRLASGLIFVEVLA